MFAPKSARAAMLLAPAMVAPLPAAAQAQTQGMQSLSDIDILVAATMGAEVGQPGGARALVDRRLKLKACPDTLEITGPDMGAAAVRCPALGWRIRVPLDLTADPVQSASPRMSPQQQQQRGGGGGLGQEGIKRGEPILLTVDRPMFSLSRVMIADKDGRVGEVIPVRDEPRGRPIFVRIVEPGRATILGN